MKRLKCLIIGIIAIAMAGCGQTVVETLNVPENTGTDRPGEGMTAVILPFADYSYGDSLASAHRRNIMVTETLSDRLNANGFMMPIQEDVFGYLINQNIISIIPYEETNSSSLHNELADEWSNEMKAEINRYITQQQLSKDKKVAGSPGTHGLTPTTVAKLGRQFKADYVVRGRILEFKTRQDPTWAPWKKGLLPFITGVGAQTFYGFAGSDQYDEWNNMAAGALVGVLAGGGAGWPFASDSTITGSVVSGNEVVWGAVGAGLGSQAYNSGRVDQAVVQLRIWIQESATGNVVWTNRIQVKVSPESIFADAQYDTLFDAAINKGVSSLIENFVNTTL